MTNELVDIIKKHGDLIEDALEREYTERRAELGRMSHQRGTKAYIDACDRINAIEEIASAIYRARKAAD